MGARIVITGAKTSANKMKRRGAKLSSMRSVNLAAVVDLDKWIVKNFEVEGRNHANKSLKWKKSKRAIKEHGKTLSDKGLLKRNWDHKATQRTGTLKSDMSYSRSHEDGVPKRNLPQRKILPEEKQAQKIVFPIYRKHVKVSIK